jgi:hypothetical protein
MTTENTYDSSATNKGGCCGGGKGASAPALPELEQQLYALWARVQEERAKQAAAADAAAKRRGAVCRAPLFFMMDARDDR